jgi:hypothetical protein
MTIAPHAGIIDFGTFTPPEVGKDGIQGEVPQPLIGQELYILTASGWSATIPSSAGVSSFDGRTGDVTLTSGDVTTALGYTPLSTAGGTITGNLGIGISYPSYPLQVAGSSATTSAVTSTLNVQGGTNLVTYSEQFDNAAWTKTAATITANSVVAPDGTTTADALIANTANALHYFSGSFGAAVTTYTLSFFAKSAGYRFVVFTNNGGTNMARGFDLSNGTTFVNASGYSEPLSYAIVPVGNGWYRCSITFNKTTATSCGYGVWLNNGSADTFVGDGTSGIFIWGAQLEPGTTASPYVATTSAAINGTSSAYFGGPVTLATTNRSAAAWTTSGINLIQSAATFTDTTSTGTVGSVYVNRFAGQTLAASNTLTVNNLVGTYFNNPTAGTNVTAGVWALGADSLLVNGTVNSVGLSVGSASTLTLGTSTSTQTLNAMTGTTSSGSTKTVNIGTGGASGSTTNITLGSSTSGATQTTTVNGQVTLAPIGGSAAAWTTSGIALTQSASTWTDTTSTGTVSQVRANSFATQTIAASSTTTYTTGYANYFSALTAGTNVTIGSNYAIGCDSLFVSAGALNSNGSSAISNTTASITAALGNGVTASSNTKTVNIGTGGASGSTTAITIGSATSGATSTTVLNGLVGVGSTNSTVSFANYRNITGGTTAYANYTGATVQSDVTSQGYGYQTLIGTQAATFTLLNLFHYRAQQGSFGAGSTVNNQYSFYSSAQNLDATTNNGFYAEDTAAVTTGKASYGFRSAINIATGGGTTYQLFMGGTAQNVIKGTVTFSGANFSQAAWTTNGVGLIQAATTYTDTTSTGTVANVRINNFAAQTLAASNSITASLLYGTYFTDPVAGTNVTASNKFAIGADSAFFASGVSLTTATASFTNPTFLVTGNNTVTLGGGSGTYTASLGGGTTASGNTKTVNIGTNGASGSTTNITLGSSTSGATQTTTINGRVTLAPIGASAAAWAGNGVALVQSAATWTDTTTAASGTVAAAYMNAFNAQTYAATNTAVTVSNAYGAYFAAPVAGTNVTITNRYGLTTEGLVVPAGFSSNFNGTINANGNVFLTTSSIITLGSTTGTAVITLGQSTDTQTTNIQAGVTASGKTKTVNIGTGGASGSTTNIAIGSATSGATSTTTLNGSTVFTGTAQLQGYTVATLPAAGTAGRRAYVTDATAPTWLGALTGGGTVKCPVFDNGTAWVAG